MNYMKFLLFLFLACVALSTVQGLKKKHRVKRSSYPASPTKFDAVLIESMLNISNNYRIQQQSSNMKMLVWDEALASAAQGWADQCNFSHPHDAPGLTTAPGQNMFLSSVLNLTAPDLPAVVLSWYNEINNYDYTNKNCSSVCGHYTQLVWAESDKVGCGWMDCPTIVGSSITSGHVVVCNYSPRGNMMGEWPFEMGTPCSACPNCINGLCSDVVQNTTTTTSSGGSTGSTTTPFNTGGTTTTTLSGGLTDNGTRSMASTTTLPLTSGGSTSTTPAGPTTTQCPGLTCENGGSSITDSAGSCVCKCTALFKGTTCTEKVPDPKLSIKTQFYAADILFDRIWSVFREKMVPEVNSFCNNKVKGCCLGTDVIASGGSYPWCTAAEVQLESGFPTFGSDSQGPITYVSFNVVGAPNNELCAKFPPVLGRRKRSAVDVQQVLNQTVLMEILQNTRKEIDRTLKECCSASMGDIYISMVGASRHNRPARQYSTTHPSTMEVVLTAGVAICILLLVVLLVLSYHWNQRRAFAEGIKK